MDLLFEDVIAEFAKAENKAMFTAAAIKPPSIIDFYMGQPEHPEYFEFTLPAIFMDYSIIPTKQGNLWVNAATLSFHCLPEIGPSTSSVSPRRTQGLKTIKFYGIIKHILDKVAGKHYTSFSRGPEMPAYTVDHKYHIIGYTTQTDDINGKFLGRYTEGTVEDIAITGESRFSLQ
jgi:hypothetical protein